MAVNEFEKNVQKVMDEFKLRPSEDVWQNVEKRIREKKKRRRIIFFIFFSCIGLGLTGYGIHVYSTKENPGSEKNNQNIAEKSSNVTNDKQKTVTIDRKNSTRNTKNAGTSQNVTVNRRIEANTIAIDQIHQNGKTTTKNTTQEKSIVLPTRKNTRSIVNAGKTTGDQEENPATVLMPGNQFQNISLNNNQVNSPDPGNGQPVQGIVPVNIFIDTVSTKNNNNRTHDVMSEIKKMGTNNKNSGNIEWGLNFSAGVSDIEQRVLFLEPKTISYNNYSTNPGTSGGGGTLFTYNQADNKSSFAFEVGARMRKKISKRSSLLTGIGYNYLSDKIRTGTKQASNSQLSNLFNISAYYAGTARQTYSDRFHLIVVPIVYDWRITSKAEHFLSVNAGTSISYLVSTNALVYDTAAGGIYYHSKKVFNQWGISVTSGLAYHRVTKNAELNIGPQFSMGLSKIIRTDLDKRKYFLYSGVDATILFGKKKKK